MSDPQAKAERSKVKDIKQGVSEQKEYQQRGKKKKIDKPYFVWTTFAFYNEKPRPWLRHKCATLEQAKMLMNKELRAYLGTNIKKNYWITYNGEKIDDKT